MRDLSELEFRALRETIRSRGTVRPLTLLAGLAAWAATLLAVLIWLPNPIAALVPLLVLVTGYEAVRTLHLGVERIGRYLQVFFEERPDADPRPFAPPAWERTAMAFGGTLPGAGSHPLFLPVFLFATLVNFVAVVLPGPLPVEVSTLAVPHAAFVVWMLVCERAVRRQRQADLARFRELRDRAGT